MQKVSALSLKVFSMELHRELPHPSDGNQADPKPVLNETVITKAQLGWWLRKNPSEKYELVNWDDYSQHVEKLKMFQNTIQTTEITTQTGSRKTQDVITNN